MPRDFRPAFTLVRAGKNRARVRPEIKPRRIAFVACHGLPQHGEETGFLRQPVPLCLPGRTPVRRLPDSSSGIGRIAPNGIAIEGNGPDHLPHRYVGLHSVSLVINEPAGPNPVPAGAGDLIGFIYTTATTGVAIYDGVAAGAADQLYRLDVPVANVTATAINGARQENIDQARVTNGAIYDVEALNDVGGVIDALGKVLGQYLFDIS